MARHFAERLHRAARGLADRSSLFKQLIVLTANYRTPSGDDFALWERKNYWLRLSGIQIGTNGVAIGKDFVCLDGLETNILIEDYTAIGHAVKFWGFNKIEIGKFCMVAAEVSLSNGGHDRDSFEPFSGALKIGGGCWIGTGARIIGPLTIGNNAIVGAGAVVVSDVPDGVIVAGVPAKVIGVRKLPEKVWHLGGTYFCPKTLTLIDGDS